MNDMNRNPSGKGGFGDNPQNRNPGGRPKNEQRFGYWLQFFKNLTSKEFKEYTTNRSPDDMYVAELIAFERVTNARKDLAEYKEVADRTEGRAKQVIEAEITKSTAELTDEELDDALLTATIEDGEDQA